MSDTVNRPVRQGAYKPLTDEMIRSAAADAERPSKITWSESGAGWLAPNQRDSPVEVAT